jgi:putative FmdB family regulatory protein
MPLYEYQCRECDTRFERIERVSAPSDGVCPSCGGPARRLLGAPALQFKGSGWYVTDYGKGNGSKPDSAAPSEHEAASESKTEASTPSETSTKTETSTKSESSTKSDSKVA